MNSNSKNVRGCKYTRTVNNRRNAVVNKDIINLAKELSTRLKELEEENSQIRSWQPRTINTQQYTKPSVEQEQGSPEQRIMQFCESGKAKDYKGMYKQMAEKYKANKSLLAFKQDIKPLDFSDYQILYFSHHSMSYANISMLIGYDVVNFVLCCVGGSGKIESLRTNKDHWVIVEMEYM